MKNLITDMTYYLANACAHLSTGDKQHFHYNAKKADDLLTILEEHYDWDIRNAEGYIQKMWETVNINW